MLVKSRVAAAKCARSAKCEIQAFKVATKWAGNSNSDQCVLQLLYEGEKGNTKSA